MLKMSVGTTILSCFGRHQPCSHRDAGTRGGYDGGPAAQYGQGARQLAHGPSRLQQFAPFAAPTVNRDNAKDLKPKFIFSIGGRATGGTLPGKEEVDPAGRRRLHVCGRHLGPGDEVRRAQRHRGVPLWRYDPKITQVPHQSRHRHVWRQGDRLDQRHPHHRAQEGFRRTRLGSPRRRADRSRRPARRRRRRKASPAPRSRSRPAGGKELVVQGESTGGQLGTRSWIGAFDVGTGKLAWRTFTIPAPGEPGSETWKDNHNAWRVGGGGVWQTASYDPGDQPTLFRHRRRLSELRSAVPARRQSLHRQHHRARRRHRQDRVVLPGDAERALGLRHAEPQDALRRQRQRRAAQGRRELLAQRLLLHARPHQRPVPARRPVPGEGHLDEGHRPQDRQAARL